MRALLIGNEPAYNLGYEYVKAAPYDAVVIGSLKLSELLYFSFEEVFTALAEGMPVVLYTPGLPQSPKNRALAAAISSKNRELKSWGIVFTAGQEKKLITAEAARALRQSGKMPPPGAVLTPLAREILS